MSLKTILAYLHSMLNRITQTPKDSTTLRAGHSEIQRTPGFYTSCMIERSNWNN